MNFIWVLILVPVVLAVFSAISATMIPQWAKMLTTIAGRLVLAGFLVSIPIVAGKIIKK